MKIKKLNFLLKKNLFNILYFILFIFNINSVNFFENKNIDKNINKESISYILKVKFPKFIKKIPNLCAYYKGYAINFDENICLIKQKNYINQFILVITPEVNHRSEGNNIKYLERVENKPCKLFYITNKINQNNKTSWYFEEENLNNLPLRLPEGSLVLLMDPNYVEGLKSKKQHEISKNSYGVLINFPKIIIKNNITYDEINNSMNYIWLAAFDSRAIHSRLKSKARKSSINNQEVFVSMQLFER